MNRGIKKILAAALLAAAPTAEGLTLDRAQELAASRYPLMADYGLIDMSRDFTLANATKAWLPQVSVGAQMTWQSAVASYPEQLNAMLAQTGVDIRGIDKLQWKASAEVTQVIWDGGRISASKAVGNAEAEEARSSVEVDMYALRSRIDDIYFGILLLEQQAEALKGSAALLDANLAKVEALVRNGAAMQSDADAIHAEALATRQQLISTQSSVASFRQMLALFIGDEANESLATPSDIIIPENNSATARPEFRLMDARKQTLDARIRMTDASVMPRIGAFAQGYYGYPGLNFMDAMMNRTPTLNAIVGLSVSWNIGTLYTRSNSIKSLQTAAERIDVAREVFSFNTSVAATRQREELRRLNEFSATDSEIVALRERVRRASEARLREGVVEPTDLLTRITEEKNAVIALNTHRLQYLKTLYELANTLNQRNIQ